MQVQLLEYNAQSKIAIVQFQGINSDTIIQILTRLQDMFSIMKPEDIKEQINTNKESGSSEVPVPDILPQNELVKLPDLENEDEMERTLKESLEILRDDA